MSKEGIRTPALISDAVPAQAVDVQPDPSAPGGVTVGSLGDPGGPRLTFSAADWQAFLNAVRRSA